MAALLLFGLTVSAGIAEQPQLGPYTPPPLDIKPANNLSVTPVTQPAAHHQKDYALVRKDQAEAKQVDLAFFGDSITWCWRTPPGKVVWKEYYAKRNMLNAGIGGAMTENVLWQMQNGFADGYKCKLMVLMIGTNNTRRDGPDEIAAGIRADLVEWFKHQPQSKVLLLGIFPRGQTPDDPRRQICEKTNAIIAKLHDGKRVFFLNINDKFLDDKGTLSRDIMPDLLHPESEEGYRIWAEGIEPMVSKTLGDKKPPLPEPKTIDRLEIGKEPADSYLRLKLPLTITLPAGKQGGFLFSDKLIVEIDQEKMDNLMLMDGCGAAWDRDGGSVGHLEYHGLQKEHDYVRVDSKELGFDKEQQNQVANAAQRNAVNPSNVIYTFGTYWLDLTSRLGDVKGRDKVRYLYTFEQIEKDDQVRVVKKRRYHVTVVAPQ